MGLMATVLAGAGTVAAGVLVKVLADDVKEWTPRITGRLLELAVRFLPEDQRERHREEWAGHLWETPGTLAKLFVIIPLPLAVLRAREDRARVALDNWYGEYSDVALSQIQAKLETLKVRAEAGLDIASADLLHIVHEIILHQFYRPRRDLQRPSLGFTIVAARYALINAKREITYTFHSRKRVARRARQDYPRSALLTAACGCSTRDRLQQV